MSEKLNVLFIITDQQRADHLGCAGNPILRTPNLDKLANEGIRFTSAYCANPICMPNRASIFTGLYPNMHGIRTAGMNLPENVPTFTETLLNQGYHTFSIGKVHLQFWTPRFKKGSRSAECIGPWLSEKYRIKMKQNLPVPYYGFKEVDMVTGHGDLCAGHYLDWLEKRAPEYVSEIREKMNKFFNKTYYKTNMPEEIYPTTYITKRTIEFLDRYAQGYYGDKPFFLHCSFPDPHHPVCPPGKYYELYKPDAIDLPKNFKDVENLKKHKFLGNLLNIPFLRGAVGHITTEEEARNFIALTYGSITMIDDGIGKILSTIEKLGLKDNTMIIFTSDHGDMMGEHGLILKGPCPFDGILRVPLIWKVPRVIKPGVTNSLASSVDISKTILNLLGINEKKQPKEMQGIDLTPILKDPNKKVRDCCFIEHDEELDQLNLKIRLRHLITEKYKLTVYNELKGYGDLFDRKNDPLELQNLWYNEKYKETRYELLELMLHENLNAQSRYPRRLALS